MTSDTRNIPIDDLSAMGFSTSDITTRVRQGKLTRLRRGVYALPADCSPEVEHRRLIAAGRTVVSDSSVVSHVSAGVLHGLPVPRKQLDVISMTRLTSGHGELSSCMRIRHTALSEDEVTEIDGARVTTLARTVFDLARSLPFEWGVMACDAAYRSGLNSAALHAASHRHPRLRGSPRARRVADFGDGRSESAAESLSRLQMFRTGIPVPSLQHELFDANGEFVARPDFLWPEYRLVGEVDGRSKYGELLRTGQDPIDAIMAEKRREESIRQLGYWIVRWDWDQAWRPAELSSLLLGAMNTAR